MVRNMMDNDVREFRSALGARLREVEKRFGNRAEAARCAGVSKSTLQNWIEGRSDASFQGLSRLAEAANVSLDWLAFGRECGEAGKPGGDGLAIDVDLLTLVMDRLEYRLERFGVEVDKEKMPRLIALLYEHFLLLEQEERENSKFLDTIIRL